MAIMTPRTLPFRIHALLALAVLAIGLGSQAWGYHGCANHAEGAGGHGGAHTAIDADRHTPAHGHTAHAPARHPVGRAHALGAPGPAHDAHPEPSRSAGHGPCTCLGTCHGSAPATTLAPAMPVAPAAVVVRQPQVRAADTRAPVTRPAFLIPYSTSPPLSA